MFLLGFLLLHVVFAAAQHYMSNLQIHVCIQEGIVKSLRYSSNDPQTRNGCGHVRRHKFWLSSFPLNLQQRDIKGFEKCWYNLKDYQSHSVNLSDNAICEITSDMLNELPSNVVEVDLMGNQVKRLKVGIIKNEHLLRLLLQKNCIHEIERDALKNLKRLQFLSLSHNRLTDTKFAATLPQSLLILSLIGNNIREISAGSFSNLGKLQELYLRSNQITELQHQPFQGLKELHYLDLGKNPIEKIENGTFPFSSKIKVILM